MTPLVLLALAAAPEQRSSSVAVLVVRRTSVTPDEARAFAEATASVLRRAQVAVEEPSESLRRLRALGVDDPTVCGGRKACVLELAKQLEVGALVAISAAALQSERSVVFEAWRTADSTQLAKDAAVLKAGSPVVAEQLTAVARALSAAFGAKAADAPVARAEPVAPAPVAPVPPAVQPRPELTEPPPAPPPERSHALSYATAALAVAAAAGAVGLGVAAANARSQVLANEGGVSMLRGSQAQALAGQHDVFAGVAGGLGAAALALGVVAVVAW